MSKDSRSKFDEELIVYTAIPAGQHHLGSTSLIFPGRVLAGRFPVPIATHYGKNRQLAQVEST